MKKFIFVIALIFCFAVGAQEIPLNQNQTYINAQAAFKSKNYQQVITSCNDLVDSYYYSPDVYALLAKSYYYTGKHDQAMKAIKFAYDLEPIYDDFALHYILISTYNKDIENIKKVYTDFSFYGSTPDYLDYYENTVNGLLNHLKKGTNFLDIIPKVEQLKSEYKSNYTVNSALFFKEGIPIYNLSTMKPADIKAKEMTAKILALKARVANKTFPKSYYNQLLLYISYFVPNNPDSELILKELFTQFKDTETTVPMRFKIYQTLAEVYQLKRQYEDEASISTIMYDDISKISLSVSMKAEVLNHKVFALIQMGKYKEAVDFSKIIEVALPSITNKKQKLLSTLNISKSYAYTGNKPKGVEFAEKGVQFSKQFGMENTDIGKAISANLVALKNQGQAVSAVNYSISSNDYTELYNAGLDLIGQKKYTEAIPFLEKSNSIYQDLLNKANDKDRSSMLLFYSKVGGCLAACYHETKQKDKIFPIMEGLKINNLVSKANQKVKPASVAEVQNTLKEDEALVYYVEVSRGFTYEGTYLAGVLTKNSFETRYVVSNGALMNVYVQYNSIIGEIENEMAKKEFRKPSYTRYNSIQEAGYNNLKKGEVSLLIELYRKFLNPNEGGKVDQRFKNEIDFGIISNSFFIDYLSKLEPYFKDKKKVIFALDGMQNLIPFETLVDLNSVYMIEKYEISYITSGTLLKELRDRKPYIHEKNVLAFGDAKYAAFQNPGITLNSIADIDRLRFEVVDLQAQNKPLDKAFATFSKEPMSYLKGAKAEVEFIGKSIPKSDIKLDNLMTENEFKKMATSGDLNKYKVIHLSSHAMVHPYIFELSSIAFSVFPTPVDGEDGMLTVAEMEKLNLKTEFMMLSACQTGLGKVVPGEGVSGLNQAMLKAGANSTLTTLWSVNDYGSYVFTANLYHNIFIKGMDYSKAVTEVKRSFIKGTYNTENFNGKEVLYWAPFIYNGK